MPALPRLAVLASGRGSNLQAILDAIAAGTLAAEIAGVFSDRPQSRALQRVDASLRWSRDAREYARRQDFDAELAAAVVARRPDWVVCAGYLRILGDGFIDAFRGRLLNIHPSLLPAYRGLRTHERALAAGEREHGASVPVLPGDDAATLANRVLAVEHPLLVATLQLAVADRIAEQDETVLLDGHALFTPLALDSNGCLREPDR